MQEKNEEIRKKLGIEESKNEREMEKKFGEQKRRNKNKFSNSGEERTETERVSKEYRERND